MIRVSTGEEMSVTVADQKELNAAVARIASTHPGRPFVLKIDKETSWHKVDLVLSALRNAGIQTGYFHTELPGN